MVEVRRSVIGIVVVAAVLMPPAYGRTGAEDIPADAFANRYAFATDADKEWASVLGLAYRGVLALHPSSSAPLGSLSRLHDGRPGDLSRLGALEFDGGRVRLDLRIAAWRGLHTLRLTAIEPAGASGRASLTGMDPAASLTRTVLSVGNSLAMVEYAVSGLGGLHGDLRFAYDAAEGSRARLGELTLNGLGLPRRAVAAGPVQNAVEWIAHYGPSQCPRIVEAYQSARGRGTRAVLETLLGHGLAGDEVRLTYWIKHETRDEVVHSMILQVDATGDVSLDLVRAWLVVPKRATGSLPLVVLPHQSTPHGSLEALGALGEEELSLGTELVHAGVAVIAVDSFSLGAPRSVGAPHPRRLWDHHPEWSLSGKELRDMQHVLDAVLAPSLQRAAGYRIDAARIGIWGFSRGAWIAALAAVLDDRYVAVATSGLGFSDAGLAANVATSYAPQFSCVQDRQPPPVTVGDILQALEGKKVLFVAPDAGLMAAWQRAAPQGVMVRGNPYNHMVSEAERAELMRFFLSALQLTGARGRASRTSVLVARPEDFAPVIQRDNEWRTKLLEALSGSR
jgi:dienelactone hydrolase